MNVWNFVKLFNRKNLWRLFRLGVKNPLFIFPTIWATRACIKTCDAQFGSLHHQNNVTNAVRHALWNVFIIRRCRRYTRSVDRAIKWADDFTTWHEYFSPNSVLAKQMDLHNNFCGQALFRKHMDFREGDFISLLKEQMKSALQIATLEEIKMAETRLVYIEQLPAQSND